MELLSKYHYDYIANDLIGLKKIKNEIKCISFPVTLGIRYSTIMRVHELRQINTDIPQIIDCNLIHKIKADDYIAELKQRVNYSVQDIKRELSCNIKSNSLLDTVFFLCYEENHDHSIKKLSNRIEKYDIIKSQLYSVISGELGFVKEYYLYQLHSNHSLKLFDEIEVYKIVHCDKNLHDTVNTIHGYLEERMII